MQHGTKARNICCRHFNFHFNYSKNDFWHTKIFALRDPPFFKHSLLGTKICRPSKLSREREPNLAPPGPSVTSIRVQTAATRQFSPHRGSPTSISSQFLSSSPLLPCAALEGNCGEGTSSTCTAPGQSAQAQFPSCSSRRDRWQMTGAVHLQSCNTLLSRLSAELLPVLQAKQWEMASPSPLVQTQPFKYHRAHTEDVLSTWYLQEQLPSWNST